MGDRSEKVFKKRENILYIIPVGNNLAWIIHEICYQ